MNVSALRRSEHLLVALANEMRQGRSDGARADMLRDDMEAADRELHAEERRLLDELSEDLFLLEGAQHVAPLADEETEHDVRLRMEEAFRDGNDRVVLLMLRKLPSDSAWPDPARAGLLGQCWQRLGFPEAAAAFYDFAYERDAKPVYAIKALGELVRASLIEQGLARVGAIESDAASPAELVLWAAMSLRILAAELPPAEQEGAYRRVLRLVERAGEDERVPAYVRSMAITAAGMARDLLRETADAIMAFDRAVEIEDVDSTRIQRGLAHLDRGEHESAMRDFRRAADLGTVSEWPFLFLARNAFSLRLWEDAERCARAGAARARSASVRAQLYNMQAIAAAELGRPEALVTQLFDRALAEDPFDASIRANSERFAETMHSLRPPPETWRAPPSVASDEVRRALNEQFLAAA